MGCQVSRAVQVRPFEPANKVPELVRIKTGKAKALLDSDADSCVGLEDASDGEEEWSGGGSASSKFSTDTGDSGLEEDYPFMITEMSDKENVSLVERAFYVRDGLDLEIKGVCVPRRLSARTRARNEEQSILQTLRKEGLISRPKSTSPGGIAFEVVAEEEVQGRPTTPRPPARLEKLQKRKKKKDNITQEEIMEKLSKADMRRKANELAKLEKIRETEVRFETTSSRVHKQAQEEAQTRIQQHTVAKMEQVIDNRERKLKEMRDKLRAKQEHGHNVRLRKLAVVCEENEPPLSARS